MKKRLSLFSLVPLMVVLPCHAADLPSDLEKHQSHDLTIISTATKSASEKNGATGSDSDLFFSIWGTVRISEINRDEDYRPSAVVVNLDFTPDEVYTELSSAL